MSNKEQRFKEIIDANNDRIIKICRYYEATCEEQKDINQEVLINIWKSLDTFRGEASISTWIYRIAVNTALSFTGKSFKRMKLHVSLETQNISSLFSDDEYKRKLEEEEQFKIIQTELNQLSVIDKSLISLMLEGLSMKEIAEIIGISEPNVRVKIHRIKENLRNKMQEESHENK